MDLDEWELLPIEGYMDFNEDSEKKMYLGRNSSDPRGVFNMDYFRCPSPNSLKPVNQKRDTHGLAKLVDPVPISLDLDLPPVITETNKAKAPNIEAEAKADQDMVSQVFFKKTEFVDMKMMDSSPRSRNLQCDDKGETLESCFSPRKIEKEIFINKNDMVLDNDVKEDVPWEENKDGGINNIWKRSLNGIGALCSFGFAAATICILIFGSHQRNKKNQQNQKFKFQIYTDDKRMNQVVHHATKLNEAISAARGVPLTRAHITYGGYYDGL